MRCTKSILKILGSNKSAMHYKRHMELFYTEAVTQMFSVKKGVLRNFAKFTGKHLCQSLFFNKVT